MQRAIKTLEFAIIGAIGIVAAALLTLSFAQIVVPRAEATPAMADGKACNTCHTSSTPSKSDVKR